MLPLTHDIGKSMGGSEPGEDMNVICHSPNNYGMTAQAPNRSPDIVVEALSPLRLTRRSDNKFFGATPRGSCASSRGDSFLVPRFSSFGSGQERVTSNE